MTPRELQDLTDTVRLPVITGIQVEWLDYDGCRWIRAPFGPDIIAQLRWWSDDVCVLSFIRVNQTDATKDITEKIQQVLQKLTVMLEKSK